MGKLKIAVGGALAVGGASAAWLRRRGQRDLSGDDNSEGSETEGCEGCEKLAADNPTDAVSRCQMQLQNIMQTYNVSEALIKKMEGLCADISKDIAGNVR